MIRLAALLLIALLAQDSAKYLPTIPVEDLHARREKLMARFPNSVLLLEADPPLRGDDANDGNKPQYDFTYIAGYYREGDIIALLPAIKKTILFSAKPESLKGYGADSVEPVDRFEEFVRDVASGSATIYSKLRKKARDIVDANKGKAEVKIADRVQPELLRMRLIKSAAEIEMIRKATNSGIKGHLAAMKACKPGMNEGALQKIYEDTFKSEGCDGLAYPCIVGGGRNGIVLHYSTNNQDLPADSLVVCDCGPSYKGYATDITRTLPTSGKFTERQRKCYQAVLDAQKAAEAICKPGVFLHPDLHQAAAEVFEKADLTDWSYAHSVKGGPRHGLGHYVGLAVHDTGTYMEPLAPGMVITIEPGYYSKADGWGIRIEDMYLITKDGCERLTASLPREIDEIEKLMSGK